MGFVHPRGEMAPSASPLVPFSPSSVQNAMDPVTACNNCILFDWFLKTLAFQASILKEKFSTMFIPCCKFSANLWTFIFFRKILLGSKRQATNYFCLHLYPQSFWLVSCLQQLVLYAVFTNADVEIFWKKTSLKTFTCTCTVL